MSIGWKPPIFLTLGFMLAFPYFTEQPVWLHDGFPPLTGIMSAVLFFCSGYCAGKRSRIR